MTNFEKISKLLDYGFKVLVYDKGAEEYTIFFAKNGDDLVCTDWYDNKDDISYVDIYSFDDEGINGLNLTITPIVEKPKTFNVGDKVDISELYKFGFSGSEAQSKQKMVGDKGLEILMVVDDSCGIYYHIYTKDKSNFFTFPAWCLTPHLEDEPEDKMQEAMELLKKNGYKIIKN